MKEEKTNKTNEIGKRRNAGKSFFHAANTSVNEKPFFTVPVTQHLPLGQPVIQMKPSYLVSHSFMGHTAEVNTTMRRRLRLVEADLQTQYDALPAPTRPATLADYAGLTSIRGWRANSGTSFHASGSAVDVNYRNQPYIATRSEVGATTVFGGERAGPAGMRRPAVEVYDRAMRFTNRINYTQFFNSLSAVIPFFMPPPPHAIANIPTADVNIRRTGETTSNAFARFKATSDALATYLSFAFLTNYDEVLRQPIVNIETATEAQLLAAIPLTERKDEASAIADITTVMGDPVWQASHPGFTQTPREIYIRMLRDYEHVRIPMVRGNPTPRPADTRNPALGFLHMPEHFVVAMHDVGNLRWGAADLGAAESGDVHHFDLNTHAGFVPDSTP